VIALFSDCSSVGPRLTLDDASSTLSTSHSKARIIESIQTQTKGAPGVSLAGIHTQYNACLVAKSCEVFSVLNMFPSRRKDTPAQTQSDESFVIISFFRVETFSEI
jgi:hypothetical protein